MKPTTSPLRKVAGPLLATALAAAVPGCSPEPVIGEPDPGAPPEVDGGEALADAGPAFDGGPIVDAGISPAPEPNPEPGEEPSDAGDPSTEDG